MLMSLLERMFDFGPTGLQRLSPDAESKGVLHKQCACLHGLCQLFATASDVTRRSPPFMPFYQLHLVASALPLGQDRRPVPAQQLREGEEVERAPNQNGRKKSNHAGNELAKRN